MDAVFPPEFFVFFLSVPINFLWFLLGINRKSPEISTENSGRNTASTEPPEEAGNGQFLTGFLDLG